MSHRARSDAVGDRSQWQSQRSRLNLSGRCQCDLSGGSLQPSSRGSSLHVSGRSWCRRPRNGAFASALEFVSFSTLAPLAHGDVGAPVDAPERLIVEVPVPGAQEHAGTIARPDECVCRAGRPVHEVPGAQVTFVILDDQDALAHEDQKVLLHGLGVVPAAPAGVRGGRIPRQA